MAGGPQRKRATATSAFGVSRRENHDASGFYARFTAPILTADHVVEPPGVVDQIYVGDARSMDRVRPASVALVVTSPPYFAGKAYEEELGEGHIPATYVEYLTMLEDVFAECVRQARAGRAHRRQRRQPRAQAVPLAVGGRDRDPAGPARPAAARRGRLAEGPRGRRQLRVGLVQEAGQPGAARPHRAHRHRQQGSLRPRRRAEGAGRPGLPSVATTTADEFMDATLDVWEMAPESATRVEAPGPVPRRAAPAADRPLHVPRRRRARPVHGLGHHRGGRGAVGSPLPRLRHRRVLRPGRP